MTKTKVLIQTFVAKPVIVSKEIIALGIFPSNL